MKAFDPKQVVFIGDTAEKPKTKKPRKKRTTKKNESPLKGLTTEEVNEKIEKDYDRMFLDSVKVPTDESIDDSIKIQEVETFSKTKFLGSGNTKTSDEIFKETLKSVEDEPEEEKPKPKIKIEIPAEPLKRVIKQSKRDYIILKIHDMNINDLMIVINDIINNGFIEKKKTDRKTLIKDKLTEFKDSKESTKGLKVSDLLIKNVNKLINFYISINELFEEDETKKIIKSLAENNFI